MENPSEEVMSKSSQIITNDDEKISLCQIMKDGITSITQKLELESPLLFQSYSDLYTRYLHSVQDIFGVCHIAEKQYFDKFEVDQHILKAFNGYSQFLTNIAKSQIEISADFFKYYIQFRLSSIDSCDKYAHTILNMYAQMLSKFIQK